MEINGTIYRILPQEEVSFGDATKKKKGGFVVMREGELPSRWLSSSSVRNGSRCSTASRSGCR